MDVYTIVIGVIVLLLVGIFFYLLYSGFFYTYSIRCTVPASIPSSYAYIVHTGPYHDVGVAFKKLTYLVPRRTLFGIYYDDPGKVCTYIIIISLTSQTLSSYSLVAKCGRHVVSLGKNISRRGYGIM